jgi:RND family efflux transporter MFP subunit
MLRSTRWYIAFLVLTAVGCAEPNVYQEPPPPKVKVASPLIQTVTNYIEETATTEAVAKVEVRARVQGFLDSVKFKPGTEVARGDLLYEIEPQLYQARVASAEADVLAQQARLKKAKLEKERQERIRAEDPGATSETTVIAAQAEFDGADAAVKQAQALLKQAQIDVQYTKIVAPIEGRVGKTLVREGNLVGNGGEATMLTTIIDYDPIWANFSISERLLLELREAVADDESGRVDDQKIPVFLSRENDQGFPFEGHFDYADLAVDQSTGTFMIRGIFPNLQRRILPGLFVTVRIPISMRENAILIPERAVTADQAGRYALVVNSENEVERRTVTTGMKIGELVVVTEGLTAEDTVITDGLQRARPGAQVTPERIELKSDKAAAEAVQTSGSNPPTPPDVAIDDDSEEPVGDGEAASTEVAVPSEP